MIRVKSQNLLKDERVLSEIDRHKWIESEKVGYDIGFDKAAEDWINRFADQWESNHKIEKREKSTKIKKSVLDKGMPKATLRKKVKRIKG